MPSVSAKVWAQQTLKMFSHTSISGDAWAFTAKGTATGDGAAAGTTIVDTNGDSGGADTYNGRYFARCLTGANKGLMKRIIDDDGAGTLTLEGAGFPNQVVSGVEYEILASPIPTVVVDSSGGETDMVDAVRAEPDNRQADAWIGYWACPITGARRGKKALITSFTAGTGTFVLAAGLGGALAAGDVVELRRFIEVEGLALNLTENYTPRPMNRKNFSRGDGVIGPRGGTIAFNMQIIPSGSLSASGVAAGQCALGELLHACGHEETPDTSCLFGAGSTTAALKIATGKWENFTVGGMIIVNGNATFIDSMVDGVAAEDTLNVTPALPVAPVTGTTCYASRMYQKSIDGDTGSVGFEVEIDGIRYMITGCSGTATLTSGPVPTIAFSFVVDHWIREFEEEPYSTTSAYSTVAPVLESSMIAYVDNARADIGGLTATAGASHVAKKVQGSKGINGHVGQQLSNYNCGATFRTLLLSGAELALDSVWLARTSREFEAVYGSHGSTFAVRIPAARLISDPIPSNADGLVDAPNVLEAQDAGYSTNGDSTVAKIPDFAFYLT